MTHQLFSRRAAAAAVVAAVSALTLAACGSDGGSGSAPAKAGSAADGVTVAGAKITRVAALHDALPDAIKKAGKVRVATDVPYAPFEMFKTEGGQEITGLDYEVGQAVGAKLGVAFEFTPTKFDGIVPAIQAGKFDAAISAMTDNKDRQKVVDFVDYSVSGSGIMVAKGNPEKITSLDDLCGKAVAVQAATHQEDLLKKHQDACRKAGKPEAKLQTFPKDSDAQLALRSGKVVAEVATKPAAGWTAKTADNGATFEVVDDPAAIGGYDATPNGIAVSKSLPQLTDAVQKALQQLVDEGVLKRICAEYGVESIAVTKATKNAGES
ncbi:ABC transporter substrate-binding protein [Streptacidiphilus sp. ASG 303]|uniref:ABC transporter substrate-binding protein n=1 Tax=Streptomycetaceae TaxID=2062 RepID=UPI001E51D922|nr:ABC transporter substrate-binding protein [Streptacidiphilus sp. ASG 303]MCD0480860.1 ABC transporter substrate-binding protein [Streptacidiphilus sp. ASG 303]